MGRLDVPSSAPGIIIVIIRARSLCCLPRRRCEGGAVGQQHHPWSGAGRSGSMHACKVSERANCKPRMHARCCSHQGPASCALLSLSQLLDANPGDHLKRARQETKLEYPRGCDAAEKGCASSSCTPQHLRAPPATMHAVLVFGCRGPPFDRWSLRASWAITPLTRRADHDDGHPCAQGRSPAPSRGRVNSCTHSPCRAPPRLSHAVSEGCPTPSRLAFHTQPTRDCPEA